MPKVSEWCEARGWTLTDAAGLTGYSVSYLSLVARGKREVGPAAKVRIARALGARVSDLFPLSEGASAPPAGLFPARETAST